jgi:hypothetical protein
MTPEDSVERQFRFQCSCGAMTVSGDESVTCSGCGCTLVKRRVRRSRQHSGSTTYYARKTLPVRRVERHRQQPSPVLAADAQTAPHTSCVIGDRVKVGPLTPAGGPHPHAGAVGQVRDIFDGHAHVVVKAGGKHYGICVSASCLEVL